MQEDLKRKKRIEHWEVVTGILMVYDFMAICFSYLLALLVRFDFKFSSIESQYLQGCYKSVVFYAIFCVILFWFLNYIEVFGDLRVIQNY